MINKIISLWKSINKKDIFLQYLWLRESYSQCAEDIILASHISKEKGVYVDIWANHPMRLNNFYLFYKKWWTWINVEPNYIVYKKLLRKRAKDINLNLGIGNGEKLDFYIIDADTLSTFDKETAMSYTKLGHKIIETRQIETITLEKLFDLHIWNKEIDILSVDVEWFDMQVLESNNWDKYKPHFIILETLEYSNEWTWKKLNNVFDPYLEDKWYRIVADTFINTIYQLQR